MRREALFLMLHSHVPRYMIPNQERLQSTMAVRTAIDVYKRQADAWAQDGFDMPQEIIDALVPGSVVEITYSSETGNMWIVMPDAADVYKRQEYTQSSTERGEEYSPTTMKEIFYTYSEDSGPSSEPSIHLLR